MVKNPPDGYQRIIPYLYYADAAAALEYLCRTFGFEKRYAMEGDGGKVLHAEAGYQGNVVMLGTPPGAERLRDLPMRHGNVLCYVDDVDAHHARAKAAGAEILAEPQDQFYGDRSYRARDPEGHEWFFHTHVRDVAPEDLTP